MKMYVLGRKYGGGPNFVFNANQKYEDSLAAVAASYFVEKYEIPNGETFAVGFWNPCSDHKSACKGFRLYKANVVRPNAIEIV